jgi:UDP-glucose 4-epimerase
MLDRPSRVVVTGAAGFIGSHLCERLLDGGHEVVGIDSFSDYYERAGKEQNLQRAMAHQSFTLHEADLVEADLARLLRGATVVFHLAGQPGVRPSWGGHFDRYVHDNIVATQRLLEALRDVALERFVFASSSSVYGDAEMYPTKESALPRPVSPYGMTKLAAEHLTFVYMRNFGLPATVLRYFTVYGPRQRPDMAFHRFMEALVEDQEIEIFGDGEQTREFTYVSDAVDGTVKAASADVVGQVVNLGGGSRVTVNRVLATLEEISRLRARRLYLPAAPGDPRHTGASINLARERLGWEPRVSIRGGLTRQWTWFQETRDASKARPKNLGERFGDPGGSDSGEATSSGASASVDA